MILSILAFVILCAENLLIRFYYEDECLYVVNNSFVRFMLGR